MKIPSVLLASALLLGGPAASAQSPQPDPDQPSWQRTVLFEARKGGYHIYRIPGLAVTRRGTLLATCEARRSDPWDYSEIDLMLRRSTDGGATWSPQAILADAGKTAAHNAMMIPDRDSDTVHFLYCVDYKHAYYAKSTDDGATFGEAVDITAVFEGYRREYNWELIATGPGHGLQLRSGRLLVPVWLSTNKNQKPTMVSVIYSDDQGRSWQRGPIIANDGDGQGIGNPMEPIAVELADGRVLVNIRTASKAERRATTISPDGVNHWEPFRFDADLPEAFCMAGITRLVLPARGKSPALDALVFVNPANQTRSGTPGTEDVGGYDRKRETVRLSFDEGKTWSVARVLEPEWSGYPDINVTPDGFIHCLYERDCIDGFMWDVKSIVIEKFNVAWVKEKPAP